MTRHTDNALIDAALRDLDPGQGAELSAAQRETARATFERIVRTPTYAPVRPEPAGPRRWRRRWRVLVPLALIAAASIVTPKLLLGGGTAFASWTPTPEHLTGAAATAAATTCQTAFGIPDRTAHIAVAERRGNWTYVLLSGGRAEGMCLMPNDMIGKNPSSSGHLYGGNYSTDVAPPPRLAPDRIAEKTSGEGDTPEGWFNWVAGYVGSKVTGITVHTSSGLDIQASVVGDRFAAWWPGIVQSSSHPEGETWSYTVHLADGSTRRTVCGQSTEPC